MKSLLTKALCAAALVLGLSACQKPDSLVGVLSFSLTKALNSSLSYDVTGVVDQTSKTITLTIPTSAGTDTFIPTFTATEYDELSIDGTALTSGSTSVKIATGTKVNVNDNVSNLSVSYTFTVLNNDNAAELTSVSFTAADNDLLDADVVPASIEKEMIVRVPEAAFQQELVMTVSAGLNDVIKVNGQNVASGSSVKVDTQFPIDIIVSDEVAKTNSSYVVKVGKVLSVVMTKLSSYTEEGCDGIQDAVMAVSPSDGLPYITYVRKRIDPKDSYNQASVIKWNGAGFEAVGDLGFTGAGADKAASHPVISFDKNGTPHVAFVDGKNNATPAVVKLNGGKWETVGGEAGKKANTSYEVGFMFDPVSNNPIVFNNGNVGKTDPLYRTLVVNSYNGSAWSDMKMPDSPTVSGTDGVFQRSRSVTVDDAVYSLAAFTGATLGGYYIYKYEKSTWTLLKANYVTEQHITAISLEKDSEGNLYAMAAVKANDVYEVKLFSVDKTTGEMTAKGPAFAAITDKTYVYQEMGINPVNNQIYAVYRGSTAGSNALTDNAPYFIAFDSEASSWSDAVKVGEESVNEQMYMDFSKDGKGYVVMVDKNTKSLVLYSVGLEADILPE